MLSFIAALLNNWRVVLFFSLILSLAGFFAVNKIRLDSAHSKIEMYETEIAELKQNSERLNNDLTMVKQNEQRTNALLAQKEIERIAVEKKSAIARKKYRKIVEESRDACINNAVPADVLGWLHDNTD